MNNEIKTAFDAVRASQRLKRVTKGTVRKKTLDYGRDLVRVRAFRRRLAGALAAFLLCVGGGGVWFLPVTCIDLDINPSVELQVNLLDRVSTFRGRNADGEALVSRLEDVRGMCYDDAMQRILISDHLKPYLEDGRPISITVAGGTAAHGQQILSRVLCRAYALVEEDSVFYCQTDRTTLRAAQNAGLTAAQYQAWQILLENDPTVTAEAVRNLEETEIEGIIGLVRLENPCGE